MKIAYQLYGSRNFPPLNDVCAMLSEIGYRYVEGYGALMDDVDAIEAALKNNNVAMHSSHMNLDLVRENPNEAIAIARRLGIEKVFVPYLDAADRPADSEGWRAFGAMLASAGEPLRDAGIAFGWHNHDFEFVKSPQGDLPIELIAESGVDLELDLGWVARAGMNPNVWIEKFSDRIISVHVKDIAPAGEALDEDGWADVGHGTISWAEIHSALQSAGIDHYIAEHDNPNDHERFAKRSFQTISAL